MTCLMVVREPMLYYIWLVILYVQLYSGWWRSGNISSAIEKNRTNRIEFLKNCQLLGKNKLSFVGIALWRLSRAQVSCSMVSIFQIYDLDWFEREVAQDTWYKSIFLIQSYFDLDMISVILLPLSSSTVSVVSQSQLILLCGCWKKTVKRLARSTGWLYWRKYFRH